MQAAPCAPCVKQPCRRAWFAGGSGFGCRAWRRMRLVPAALQGDVPELLGALHRAALLAGGGGAHADAHNEASRARCAAVLGAGLARTRLLLAVLWTTLQRVEAHARADACLCWCLFRRPLRILARGADGSAPPAPAATSGSRCCGTSWRRSTPAGRSGSWAYASSPSSRWARSMNTQCDQGCPSAYAT